MRETEREREPEMKKSYESWQKWVEQEKAARTEIKEMKLSRFSKISKGLFAEINSEIIYNQNVGVHDREGGPHW